MKLGNKVIKVSCRRFTVLKGWGRFTDSFCNIQKYKNYLSTLMLSQTFFFFFFFFPAHLSS